MSLGEARSALAWWLEAGVDVAVQEAPRDWLKPIAPKRGPVGEPAPPPNLVQPSQDTLAELQDWLASSVQLPLAGPGARRVLPQGPENAPVMLLTDSPALEDAAAGPPLRGGLWGLPGGGVAGVGNASGQAYN